MGNVAPNAINASLFRNLAFDPVADFAPVSLVASTPNILVVHPSTAARNVGALVALAARTRERSTTPRRASAAPRISPANCFAP